MKQNEQELLSQASDAVAQCFAEVPFCTLKWGQREVRVGAGQVDRVGKLRIEGRGERTVLMEVKKSGQPRNVREAILALSKYRASFKNAYGILVAPFISDESAEILAEEDVGYVDLAGNCRICLDKVYIRKEGNSNKFTEKRDLRSLYSPKAERVLRILMLQPKKPWLLKPLAEAAGVSLGQASNVKKLLAAREWLCPGEAGFSLTRPKALLDEWSNAYRSSRNSSTEFYAMQSLDDVERAIAGENETKQSSAALTAFSAAARLAPVVRYQRVAAFVSEPSDAVASRLGWKRVTSGGNVTLLQPYDEGVFIGAKKVDGIQIVSPVQAYLDLQANPSRGAEAAEALLREVLEPSW